MNDSGFGLKVRVRVQKSEVPGTAQKSELQPDGLPKSDPDCSKQVPELGFGASPEKAFFNPSKIYYLWGSPGNPRKTGRFSPEKKIFSPPPLPPLNSPIRRTHPAEPSVSLPPGRTLPSWDFQ